ncbi:MAG: DUF2281 domain-containing protein [Candidatus Edwardsbacteria bacterium]
MATLAKEREYLKKEIESLPTELLQETLDFIEFLILKKSGVDYTLLTIQQNNLQKIWASEAEDLYEL